MTALLEQGVIGIVTGILTTIILFTLKVFWSAKVTPFLVGIRYQGVEIGGQWSGSAEVTEEDIAQEDEVGPPFKSDHSLLLIQNAHNLSGSFLFNFKSEEKEFSIDFNVTGYMWEGYVTLNLTPKDKRVTSYGTALLKLHGGGISLEGTWLFRDVLQEIVTQAPLHLNRNPNM